jgi:hypothetical protein
MRQDMKDLLLEHARNGGSHGKYASSRRAELKRADADDLPRFISSSRHRGGGKELGDRLAPLRKFLRRSCGRPWADVYSDICEAADTRTIRGYHLRQHVWQFVVPDRYDIGHRGHYGPFFVDDDGTLQEERKLTQAERDAIFKINAKRFKWPKYEKQVPNPRLVEDADHWWEKIEGYWYAFETTRWTTKNSMEDLIEEDGEIKIIRIPLRDVHHHSTSKKQVDSKTQKKLDVTYLKRKAA